MKSRPASGRSVWVVFNPTAGSRRRRVLEAVVSRLAARNLRVSVAETGQPGDAERLAARAIHQGADIVAAAGGDGTIREVATSLVGQDAHLGIVPLGTANVTACELGLPRAPDAIAGVIATGTPRPLHVPRANGKPFLLMASAGFDAAVVESVSPSLKRRFGKGAFALQALRIMATGPRPSIRIEADDTVHLAQWVVVANAARYAGSHVLAPGADIGSPELAVCLFDRIHPLALAGHVARIARAGAQTIVRAGRVRLTSDRRVPIQIDGDAAGQLPLTLESTSVRVRTLGP